MIRVLMGDKDMFDRLRIDIQLAHLLPQPGIVISGVDHDRGAVFGVEENVGDPLPDTGDVIIDPSGVEGFENFLSPVDQAHGNFLHLRIFS